MKKKVLIWEIIGFLTVCALSGVFHFIYDWSGKQAWIGFFCPVNESTWEHLKLLFFPVLVRLNTSGLEKNLKILLLPESPAQYWECLQL